MKCKIVKNLLTSYVDNELQPEMKNAIEKHLIACQSCNEELTFLREYHVRMTSLQKIKAPADFLEKVHQRLETSSNYKEILRKLFVPVKIKIPLEAAGVLATVIIIILLYKPFEPVRDITYLAEQVKEKESMLKPENAPDAVSDKGYRVRKPPPERKRELTNKEEVDRNEGFIRESSPASMDKKRKTISTAGAEKRMVTAVTRKVYKISLLVKSDMPAPRSSLLYNEKKITDIDSSSGTVKVPKLESGKSIELADDNEAAETKTAERPAKKVTRDLRDHPMVVTSKKIKLIAGSLKGNIINEKYNMNTTLPESVSVEIPAGNYKIFTKELNRIGRIQNKFPPVTEKDREAIQIRIKFIQSK